MHLAWKKWINTLVPLFTLPPAPSICMLFPGSLLLGLWTENDTHYWGCKGTVAAKPSLPPGQFALQYAPCGLGGL